MNKLVLRRTLIVVGVAAGSLLAYGAWGWNRMGDVNSLGLNLAQPDALVVTSSLSTLPRDLLTVPLAHDLLSEDFLFYYEQTEDRLGLKGSLRRIAYEHELAWGDQLLKMVLDQPAEVALWRDADGSLKHYAIAVSRSKLARLIEEAGKVALKDTQMTLAGELRVDGDTVKVFALKYAHQRTMLFAAHGERMVILSNPGMLYGGKDDKSGDRAAETVVASLLAGDKVKQQLFHPQFHLEQSAGTGHSIAVKADFLSFGYQPFFGALQALRFDFDKGRWQSKVLIDAGKLQQGGYDSRALWQSLPYDPAACFAVPVDWSATKDLFQRFGADQKAPLSALFHGPAAACWYGSSRLHTPVFVGTFGKQTDKSSGEAQLGAIFSAIIGGQGEVKKTVAGGVSRWQRTVTTASGDMTPTLALAGDTVVFSADAALVDQVLAVKAKRAPAAADRVADPAHVVGLIAPSALATLIQAEAFDTLPAKDEPVLRAAADQHLVPRLDALKKYPPYRMVLKQLPASGVAWRALEWQAVPR
jgi:uncharacterized protein YfaA (DUF2138 family)